MDRHESVILNVTPGEGIDLEEELLAKAGHPVLACGGPSTVDQCPVLVGEECPLVEVAHGVVFQVDLDVPAHRAVLSRYREILPEGTPLRVVVRPGQRERYAELLGDLAVWTRSPTVADLDGFASLVEAADATADAVASVGVSAGADTPAQGPAAETAESVGVSAGADTPAQGPAAETAESVESVEEQ